MDINELVEQATEVEALELHYRFARKFGWASTLYVREDANDLWHDDENLLTDEQWEAVKVTSAWSRMGEYLSEEAYGYAREAVSVAKAQLGKHTVTKQQQGE